MSLTSKMDYILNEKHYIKNVSCKLAPGPCLLKMLNKIRPTKNRVIPYIRPGRQAFKIFLKTKALLKNPKKP